MQIWVDENIPQGDTAFSPYGQIHRFHGRKLQQADLLHCDALIVRSITKVNAGLLNETPVRFVGTATIGVDHIDQAYLSQRGIGFSAAPGCNALSVAEYVVAALLHLHLHRGLELDGKCLGIVGYGHVGKAVAKLAPHLGLNVLLCDPLLEEKKETGPFHSYAQLLQHADILSFHVPLTRTGAYPTASLFDLNALQNLAKPITLLNTCRGEVTTLSALLEGRRIGKISHLVLDVFPDEPTPKPELIAVADLVSPHIAGYSLQGKLGGTEQVQVAFCKHFGLAPPSPLQWPAPLQPTLDFSKDPVTPKLPYLQAIEPCVRHAYAIATDDQALRAALLDNEAGAGFDRLRQKYPIRHEFRNYLVSGLPVECSAIKAGLRNLGFQIED